MERIIEVASRLFAGCILCFFAFAPGYILFHVIPQVIENPNDMVWGEFVALMVCCFLLYFLLLLAYRAFTGRGRKKDGGYYHHG